MKNLLIKLGRIILFILALILFGHSILYRATIGSTRDILSKGNLIEVGIVTIIIIALLFVKPNRSEETNKNETT
jgi:uncharacterized membrane protein